MKFKEVYVIKDSNGNYISPRKTELGWYFVIYTGIDSGFTFYTNKDSALDKLEGIKDTGYCFNVECIDYNEIGKGRIIEI